MTVSSTKERFDLVTSFGRRCCILTIRKPRFHKDWPEPTSDHHQRSEMPADRDLQQVYADAMRLHPFGFALYHPCDNTILKPGSCGYFNSRGVWNPIAHVSVAAGPFVAVDKELDIGPLETLEWGPKCSEHVNVKRIKAKVNT